MVSGMTSKLLEGAAGAMALASGAARHVAWLVSYHVGGTTHDGDPEGDPRPGTRRRR
jgi:hypothetical protein